MQVLNKNQTIMRWLKHRGGAQHHARWGKEKAAPLPAAVVLGADPGTILAAVTPVPETLSEYQFAGLAARAARRAGRLRHAAAESAGRSRDRDRGRSLADRLSRRRPLWRSHRLLQFGRAVSGLHRHRDHHAPRSDLSLHLYRPAAGRAVHAGRGAERSVRAAAAASNFPRSSISGCRRKAAPIASPWCR